MTAALRLALPFLRSSTPWWIWPPLLLWLSVVWLDWGLRPSHLGFGAVVGGGMMLALSWILGAHLRHCSTQKLARALPHFHYHGLLAVAAVLLLPIALFSVLDGLPFETLLALLTATALGLGFGLGLPVRVLGVASMALLFGTGFTDQGFSLVWTSDWSPVIAAGSLVLGIGRFLRIAHQRPAGTRAGPFPYRVSGDARARGRQPHQLGRLFNHWPLAIAYTGMGLLLGIWQLAEYWPGERFDGPVRDDHGLLSVYLIMFSGLGVIAMLQLLVGSRCLQLLRKLAVLPGWSRDRLFVHVELSGWRGGLTQIFVLGVALLALGLGTGAPDFQVGLNAVAFLWMLVALGIYIALWLAREPNFILRGLTLLFVLAPFVIIASVGFASRNFVKEISPAATLAGLVSASLLAWWLRGRARIAWSGIRFRRETRT